MSNIKKQILDSEPLCKLLAYWLCKKANFFSDNSNSQITPCSILQPNHQRITGREIQERRQINTWRCDIPRPPPSHHHHPYPSPPPAAAAPPPPPPYPPPPSLQSFSSSGSSCPE